MVVAQTYGYATWPAAIGAAYVCTEIYQVRYRVRGYVGPEGRRYWSVEPIS